VSHYNIIRPRQGIKPLKPSVDAIELDNVETNLVATVEVIKQARRKICIYSRDLEHELYANNEVVDALKYFVINSRGGCVQIILQDTLAVRSRPHPLLSLAERLSSSFLFRKPVETEDLQYPSVFLINDCEGYIFRLVGERYEANWSPTQPARTRQLSEIFERMWERSSPCAEFRRLGL
jgi:hypothetical protein